MLGYSPQSEYCQIRFVLNVSCNGFRDIEMDCALIMHINKSSGGGAGVGVLLFDLLLDMHLQQTM